MLSTDHEAKKIRHDTIYQAFRIDRVNENSSTPPMSFGEQL